MKKLIVILLCLGCFAAVSVSSAIDLKQSKITQVVNDVQIISAADQNEKNASVNDIFNMLRTAILRTGPGVARGTGRGGRDCHPRRREHDFFLRPGQPHD